MANVISLILDDHERLRRQSVAREALTEPEQLYAAAAVSSASPMGTAVSSATSAAATSAALSGRELITSHGRHEGEATLALID